MTPDKIIPLYVVIDDILKSQGHQDQKLVQVTDAEIITAAVVSAKYFNNPNCQFTKKDRRRQSRLP
jgi:hypothetical protein